MIKDENIKEKFKQALISTVKAISEEFDNNTDLEKKNKSSNFKLKKGHLFFIRSNQIN